LDTFVFFNLALFLLMAGTVYYDRFIEYRGTGNLLEFYIYAIFIIGLILVGWRSFRQIEMPRMLLVFIELGILMHFAGGLVFIDGQRLYDHFALGIRYDKYVHFTNALLAAAATDTIFARKHLRLSRLRPLVILLVVLGMGAVIEIMEYLVTITVPHNGVGDYDNNMQDLIGNLTGGFTYIVWRNLWRDSLPEIGGHG
jgi:hypothetical protein